MQKKRTYFSCALLAVATLSLTATSAHALIFNFTEGASLQASANRANVVAGFNTAAALWSSILVDPITINVDIDYQSLGPGILGSTGSSLFSTSYSNFLGALTGDATSANDALAVAALPASQVNMLINHTSQNGNSATGYFDNNGSANNTTIVATSANLKAAGFTINTASDASITFSSNFAFDFNRANGINASQFDFVGIAAHEIGHALGFVSAVDSIDTNPGQSENFILYAPNPLDLFRFSAASLALGTGVIDMRANNAAKSFDIDRNTTTTNLFSNGQDLGDGNQASHWKDSLGLGIMDPTAAQGEFLSILQNDINAMDVIGWDITPAPEPGTVALMVCGGVAALAVYRRRQKSGY